MESAVDGIVEGAKAGRFVYLVIDEWDDGLDLDRRELTASTFEEALRALKGAGLPRAEPDHTF